MASPPDTKPEVADEKAISVMEQDDDLPISNIEEQPLFRRIDLHLIWAVVLGCHAASENFAALCSGRVLLGAFEAIISPGFTLITGLWYEPSEHAKRHSLWFVGNAVGSLIGSLNAYGCTFVTGGPLAPWRWLFIVLSIITAGWAVVLYIWLPDTPATARFLNPAQRVWAMQRPQVAQRSFKTNKWSNAQLLEAMMDPKTWFQFFVITTVFLSNGVIVNLPSTNSAGRYIGLILCASCANVFPMMLSLISSNVAGFTKKSTVNAVFFLGYCAGNIAGPQFFIPTEAPKYKTAFTALQYLAWENSRRDKAQGEYIDAESPERDAMPGAVMETTDQTDFENNNFRYYL
ncbi:allantoate ureidosuccinate permease [Fusarium denticulatum]|uniref:Allantoate ureidosuccinate permease n=1 Tax=Fusarium denticulatum TaxID=48507 RepID=A0A8H5WVV3_9HYPO|nr:allantoate ureidosuccinate permease [Fusarium denticulatum]